MPIIDQLVKRARLQRITNRASDLDTIRGMIDGTWAPAAGDFTPNFTTGSARERAWRRAIKQVDTAAPLITEKALAALDLEGVTWSGASDRADDILASANLPALARELLVDLRVSGAAAAIASRPEGTTDPTLNTLRGVNVPYLDNITQAVTGWYRALQYVDDRGRLTWWVDVWEFTSDETAIQRVWRNLSDPTALGAAPNGELASAARPRFALAGLQEDGLPASPTLAKMGRILGLYATELRLVSSEELASYPMLYTKGDAGLESVGPGEIITLDADGDAGWLAPGSLEELRQQVELKRTLLREAFSLPGGSLGEQTPSGEALEEANRAYIQAAQADAAQLGSILSQTATDYLALHGIREAEPVSVTVPLDRSWLAKRTLPVLEKGIDLGALPLPVVARAFQGLVNTAYSDDELAEFVESLRARSQPGSLSTTDVEFPA